MVLFGVLLTLAICAVVFAVGRGPEREAVLMVLVGLGASLLLQAVLGFRRQPPILITDIGLAAAFIWLAHVHRRAWLGLIGLVMIALLVTHAFLAEAPYPALRMAVNGLNLLGLALLVAGAVAEARGRRRAAGAARA